MFGGFHQGHLGGVIIRVWPPVMGQDPRQAGGAARGAETPADCRDRPAAVALRGVHTWTRHGSCNEAAVIVLFTTEMWNCLSCENINIPESSSFL